MKDIEGVFDHTAVYTAIAKKAKVRMLDITSTAIIFQFHQSQMSAFLLIHPSYPPHVPMTIKLHLLPPTASLHVHSKSNSTHSHSRQSRHLTQSSINSLLHRPPSRSLRGSTSRSSRIRARRHQPSSNKTRSLRQLAVNRRLRLHAIGERHSRRQADSLIGGVISRPSVGSRRVEDLVNNVQHAVFDENVGVDDACGIDEDRAVGADGDFELFAVQSGKLGVVAERGAVAYCALDDVVLQD